MSEQPPATPLPAPAAASPSARPIEGIAIASLVLGILSPIGASFYGLPGVLLGSAAVFLGLRARGRIKKSGGVLGGGGIALVGWILGICGIVVGVLWGLFLFALFMAMGSGADGAGKG